MSRPRRPDPPRAAPSGPAGDRAEAGAGAFDFETLRAEAAIVAARVLGERVGHPDVQDCAQEAMRRAIEGRRRLRSGEPAAAWVAGIARHVALDSLRVRYRTRRTVACAEGPDAPDDAGPPGRSPSPDEEIDAVRRARRVAAALEALPAGPREALRLFHGEGLGYEAIGRRLGVPVGTVATWIARGRRSLAAAIDREDGAS